MNIAEIKKIFFIEEQDLQNLRQVAPIIIPHLPTLVEALLDWVKTESTFSKYLPAEVFKHSYHAHLQHWTSFFNGVLDDAHLAGREQAGQFISKVGVPLDVYYGVIHKSNELFEAAFEHLGIASSQLSNSFHKVADLDVFVVVNSFLNLIQNVLKEQNKALSTPVAELWNGILFLPLVGIIDSKRAQDIMLTMLHKIASSQSKVFILDISGVGVIDTAVANHLIKVTKATKLMGCICIISGISPAVAQTMVELGIQIDEISTTGTMKDALQDAFKLTGVKME